MSKCLYLKIKTTSVASSPGSVLQNDPDHRGLLRDVQNIMDTIYIQY